MMNVRHVVIVTKPKQPEVAKVAAGLVRWFASKSIVASLDPASAGTADLCVHLAKQAATRPLGSR